LSFHVTLRFRPGGPAIEGAWDRAETAGQKFREWVGLHAQDGVTITLIERRPGGERAVKTWPPTR
jgi:hypothetical protein